MHERDNFCSTWIVLGHNPEKYTVNAIVQLFGSTNLSITKMSRCGFQFMCDIQLDWPKDNTRTYLELSFSVSSSWFPNLPE